jgi:Domain of unknown function (DUF4419)
LWRIFQQLGPVERAASEVVLLDTLHAYFSYEVRTVCGIPTITLEGTPEDWRSIARRVRAFSAFDLNWWIDPVLGICEQFVRASEGTVDPDFWNSIYKWQGPDGSGDAYVTGWVLKLFPYLDDPRAKLDAPRGKRSAAPLLCRNGWLAARPAAVFPGRDDFPASPAKAPFQWQHMEEVFEMEFVGGLMGIAQNPTNLCLRPEIGWAVRHAPA